MSSVLCEECGDTGKIALFTSTVDCDCQTQKKDFNHPVECRGTPRPFIDDSSLKNGWFSAIEYKERGGNVYEHLDTEEPTLITEISSKSEPCRNPPDLIYVGVVDRDKPMGSDRRL